MIWNLRHLSLSSRSRLLIRITQGWTHTPVPLTPNSLGRVRRRLPPPLFSKETHMPVGKPRGAETCISSSISGGTRSTGSRPSASYQGNERAYFRQKFFARREEEDEEDEEDDEDDEEAEVLATKSSPIS